MIPAMQGTSHGIRQPVRMVTIDSSHDGQRIDNFLLGQLKGVPRTRVYRLLRTGEVRVNKGRVRQGYRLQIGDQIRIPPVRCNAPRSAAMANSRDGALIEACALYESKHVLVLNKPSGFAVHGGSGLSGGIIEILRATRTQEPFLELAHRLDRDTSGCLLVAKQRSALRALHQALRDAAMEKRYLCLVKGRLRGGAQRVDEPLRRNTLRSGERLVRVDNTGKASRTVFRTITDGKLASLLRACPRTGRTHQIRVHATSIGHPVAGDAKYGDKAFNREMRSHGLHRLFLHAEFIKFREPGSGEWVSVRAPLPDDLTDVLARISHQDTSEKLRIT